MSGSIALSEAPQKLLDQNKWAEVRAFAPNDLIALTYLNAPYPDLDAPSDFFWGAAGRPIRRFAATKSAESWLVNVGTC